MCGETFRTPLGNLEIVEIYAIYDLPRLFVARSGTGQLYVCLWVEEQSDADRWLLLPVSRRRLRQLRKGEVTLRQAFVNAEDGFVLSVTTPFEERNGIVDVVPAHAIPDEDLPASNAKLTVEAEFEVAEYARRSGRVTLDLTLDRGEDIYEIESEHLGKLLQSCQRLFYALAHGRPTLWGRTPTAVREQATLLVTEVFASSVGVRLTLAQPSKPVLTDMLDPAVQAVESFGRLLEKASAEPDAVLGHGPRVATHFRGFIGALHEARAGVVACWSSPRGDVKGSAKLTDMQVSAVVDALSKLRDDIQVQEEAITITGILEGVNVRRGSFELIDKATRERIRGKLDPGLADRTRFIIRAPCEATLKVVSELDLSAGIEQVSYTLINISQEQSSAGSTTEQ